jgi:hypothetical protein
MSQKKLALFMGMMAFFFLAVASLLVRASSVQVVQVGALTEQTLTFNLSAGQTFTGSLAISGGSGNDINFWITDPEGATIVNLGRVSQGGSFDFTAQMSGAYTLYFDNSFSLLSSKTVSLTYDIGFPTIAGLDLGQVLTILGIIMIFSFVILVLAVASLRRKRTAKANPPPPPPSSPPPSSTQQ